MPDMLDSNSLYSLFNAESQREYVYYLDFKNIGDTKHTFSNGVELNEDGLVFPDEYCVGIQPNRFYAYSVHNHYVHKVQIISRNLTHALRQWELDPVRLALYGFRLTPDGIKFVEIIPPRITPLIFDLVRDYDLQYFDSMLRDGLI